jgi:predicted MFS family arabinose efflux permease
MRSPFANLFLAACGAHAAEQTALAALPLTAALVLGADARGVGLLVAAQGAAWLAGSLPAGLLVDRLRRRDLIVAAQLIGALGLCAATLAGVVGSTALLGLAAFFGALGTVVFVLTTNALVPEYAARQHLGSANARMEFARALVTLAAPVIVGFLAQRYSPILAYALAAIAALAAARFAMRLPTSPAAGEGTPHGPRRPALAAIGEGARFVVAHPLLGAIALCAIVWNLAFFATIAVFVPYALTRLSLDPAAIGLAQSGYGAGLLLGASAAPLALRVLGPNVVLLAGPGLSIAAPLAFLAAPGGDSPVALAAAVLFAGQFMLGFGPMMWLVCQTSIRQIVTPGHLIGRVSAAVQLAVYGVRPLGAVLGGLAATRFGPDAALVASAVAFAVSFAVVAASALARLRAMPATEGVATGCPSPARPKAVASGD